MHEHVNPKNGQPASLISDEVYEIICQVGGLRSCVTVDGHGVAWVAVWSAGHGMDSCMLACTFLSFIHTSIICFAWCVLCMGTHFAALTVLVLGVLQNTDRLDSEIIYDRDFDYDYFGFKVGYCYTEHNTGDAVLLCL